MIPIDDDVHMWQRKDNYLSRVAAPLKADDPRFKSWKLENNIIMSWLTNFMNNEIKKTFFSMGHCKKSK